MKETLLDNEEGPDDFSFKDVPEGFKLAGIALAAILAPTLFYCAVTGELAPFYVMACDWVLGTAVGVTMYRLSSHGFMSCVPVTRVRNAARAARVIEFKKAA
jgi:hypothetical protein